MKINLSVSEDLANFINAQIASGKYASTNDVLIEALHLLEYQNKIEQGGYFDLNKTWQEGIDSGDLQDMDFDAIKSAGQERLKAML